VHVRVVIAYEELRYKIIDIVTDQVLVTPGGSIVIDRSLRRSVEEIRAAG